MPFVQVIDRSKRLTKNYMAVEKHWLNSDIKSSNADTIQL